MCPGTPLDYHLVESLALFLWFPWFSKCHYNLEALWCFFWFNVVKFYSLIRVPTIIPLISVSLSHYLEWNERLIVYHLHPFQTCELTCICWDKLLTLYVLKFITVTGLPMYFRTELFISTQAWTWFFLRPDRLSSRKYVTSDNVSFRPDIRQNLFLKKIRSSRVCVALKTIWGYYILINIKLR